MKYYSKRDLIGDNRDDFDIPALLISAFLIFMPLMLLIVVISVILMFLL